MSRGAVHERINGAGARLHGIHTLFVRTLLVAGLSVVSIAAGAQAEPRIAIPNAAATFVDTAAPTGGQLTAPETANKGPITITYSGVTDDGGSGLHWVALWTRHGETGQWFDTGLRATEDSGTFTYTELVADGRYFFALQAEDNAGNLSPEPSTPGASTVFDTTPPSITLRGRASMRVGAGAPYVDEGATATDAIDGDLTGSIQVTNGVNADQPGTYTVTYNVSDKAGNAAGEVSRTVEVVQAFILTLVQPSEGTLSAEPQPRENGEYDPNTEVTVTYTAPSGSRFDLTSWSGATAQDGNPNVATVVMNSAKTVSVSLARAKGTISVNITPDNASWTVTDGDGQRHSFTGDKELADMPTGQVSITYNPLEGAQAPNAQNATLAKGATVNFAGTYTMTGGAIVAAPDNIEGTPGDTLDCPIRVTGAVDMTSYAFTLNFDGGLLECGGVAGGAFTGSWGSPVANIGAGSVSVTASGGAVSGGGTLAVLRLKVKDTVTSEATTPLRLASASLNGGALEVTAQDGQFSILVGEFTWGDADGNGTVDSTDAQLILQYLTGRVETLPALEGSSGANYVGGVDVSGDHRIGVLDSALVRRKVQGSINTFPADLNGDGAGPDIPPAGSPDTAPAEPDFAAQQLAGIDATVARVLSVPAQVQCDPGQTVRVQARIDNAARVLGYTFALEYDGQLLEFANISKGALAESWTEPAVNASTLGVVVAAGAGADGLPGESGVLAEITFNVTAAAQQGSLAFVNLVSAELNDGTIPVEMRAAVGGPVLAAVSPAMGATYGGSVVTLTGTNMYDIEAVFFGGAPAQIVDSSRTAASIKVITPEGGAGVVDVEAQAFGETSALAAAFTYFEPQIHLAIEATETAVAGDVVEVAIWLTAGAAGGPNELSFTLNFDSTMFAAAQSGLAGGLIDAGAAATSAGKNVAAQSAGPGKLRVAVSGSPQTAVGTGQLCVIRLVAIGNALDTVGLIYISDLEAIRGGRPLLSASSVRQ